MTYRKVMISLFAAVLLSAFIAGAAPARFYVIPVVKKYKNTVIVVSWSSERTSGEALLSALANIYDASETKRYLLVVEPGVYDIGSKTLRMKPYVDIAGYGETETTITGNIDGYLTGVVSGCDNAELSHLTVKNTGGGDDTVAVIADGVFDSFKITCVTAEASGAVLSNTGVYFISSTAVMTHVTASASGGEACFGVYCDNSYPVMKNVTATASDGTDENYGVLNDLLSDPIMTDVTATASGGGSVAFNCGVYNELSFPVMTSVTATASDGDSSFGVFNIDNSSPVMNNVTAEASGGVFENYGIYNEGNASPTMTNVTAKASGGGSDAVNYGVLISNASPEMKNVTAEATAVYMAIGVVNFSASPTMEDVTVSVSSESVNFGVWNIASYPVMTNVTITASGGMNTLNQGVYNASSSPTMTFVTAVATDGGGISENYGVYNEGDPIVGSNAEIFNSILSGDTNSIYTDEFSHADIYKTELDGPIGEAGRNNCTFVFDNAGSVIACP